MQFNSRTRKQYQAGGLSAMTYESNSALNPSTPKGQSSTKILNALSLVSGLDPSGVADGISAGWTQYQRNANNSKTQQWMQTASAGIAAKQGYGALISANNWITDQTSSISSQYGRDAFQYGPLPWLNPFYWIFGHVKQTGVSEPDNSDVSDDLDVLGNNK